MCFETEVLFIKKCAVYTSTGFHQDTQIKMFFQSSFVICGLKIIFRGAAQISRGYLPRFAFEEGNMDV